VLRFYIRPVILHFKSGAVVQKSILLAAIQKEIQRHDLSYFVDEPPSVAQGGRGRCRGGLSGVQKADQYDQPVFGSSDQ